MWAQWISTALGLWLYASPGVLGFDEPGRTVSYIVGPLAASFAFVAASEITRGLRWVNLPIGLWLVLAPWVLGFDPLASINSVVVGVLLAALAMVKGRVSEAYGGGWSSLLRLARGEPAQPEPESRE